MGGGQQAEETSKNSHFFVLANGMVNHFVRLLRLIKRLPLTELNWFGRKDRSGYVSPRVSQCNARPTHRKFAFTPLGCFAGWRNWIPLSRFTERELARPAMTATASVPAASRNLTGSWQPPPTFQKFHFTMAEQTTDIIADEDPLLISQSLTYVTDDGGILHSFRSARLSTGMIDSLASSRN